MKEGADSILSEPEESEDEVFGSKARTRPLRPPEPPAVVAPHVTAPAPAPQPVAPPQAPPAPQVVPSAANPFADFDAPPSTSAPSAPRTSPAKDDFREDEEPRQRKKRDRDREDRDRDERDKREDRGERDESEPRKEKPAKTSYSREGTKSGGGSGIAWVLLLLVCGYALLATGAAVYGWFFKSGVSSDTGHPLSTIPDNFGEFDPATRKKVTKYSVPVDGALPPQQRAKLGETITVGQLEIVPKEIKKRQLIIETEGRNGEQRKDPGGTAFVLRLDIKNNSDFSIYPMDPAFTRKSSPDDDPITRIVVNKSTYFAGGAVPWPWPSTSLVKKRMEAQQKNDFVPLAPGESREYVVFTDGKADVIRAVEKSNDEMQWRVQVRREPITYHGKEIPVTAIIGVDFTAADITK